MQRILTRTRLTRSTSNSKSTRRNKLVHSGTPKVHSLTSRNTRYANKKRTRTVPNHRQCRSLTRRRRAGIRKLLIDQRWTEPKMDTAIRHANSTLTDITDSTINIIYPTRNKTQVINSMSQIHHTRTRLFRSGINQLQISCDTPIRSCIRSNERIPRNISRSSGCCRSTKSNRRRRTRTDQKRIRKTRRHSTGKRNTRKTRSPSYNTTRIGTVNKRLLTRKTHDLARLTTSHPRLDNRSRHRICKKSSILATSLIKAIQTSTRRMTRHTRTSSPLVRTAARPLTLTATSQIHRRTITRIETHFT